MMDAPTAGRFEGREHRLPVRVYYEDTDFTGLVYHANYLRYFERGRSDCLRLMGIGHAELLDGDRPMAFVVSKMGLTFLKPARIDDQLVVRTHYDAVKGPRLLISRMLRRPLAIRSENVPLESHRIAEECWERSCRRRSQL